MDIMYDSTEPFDIPADAEYVAGYRDGKWQWPVEGWRRFATPNVYDISVYPYCTPATILDVEASDAPTAGARRMAEKWVGQRLAIAEHPIIYTSLDTAQYFRGLFCSFWLAHYTGEPHMVFPAGLDVIATQFASPDTGSGGHYDLSLLSDRWPRYDKKGPTIMDKMLAFRASPTGQGYWIATVDGVYAYGDVADINGHPVPMFTAETFHDFIVTPSGKGYWLVDKSANLYAYGDAPFMGHP